LAGTFLAYPAVLHQNLPSLYLTAGCVFGMGSGIAYMSPIVCVYKWLPKHKGFVSGVILAGYGGGALVFDPVATFYANPGNVNTIAADDVDDDVWPGYIDCNGTGHEVCQRASTMYVLLGFCYTALLVVGVALISDPPAEPSPPAIDTYLPLTGDDGAGDESGTGAKKRAESAAEAEAPSAVAAAAVAAAEAARGPQTVAALLLEPLVPLTVAAYFATAVGGLFLTGTYKSFAGSYFTDDQYLALVGSIASFGNLSGRLFWGWLCDCIGWRNVLLTFSSLQTFLVTQTRNVVL
jgi:OFA family oxalate/formate antiporter-like MFS transporter